MAEPDVPADLQVVWGARVGIERGYRLEAIAVQLCADIAELREDGGLPDHIHTRITVLPSTDCSRSGSRACPSRPIRTAPLAVR